MLLRKTRKYRIECDDGIRRFTYIDSGGIVINGPPIRNPRTYEGLKNGYAGNLDEIVNEDVDVLFKVIHGDVDEAAMVA